MITFENDRADRLEVAMRELLDAVAWQIECDQTPQPSTFWRGAGNERKRYDNRKDNGQPSLDAVGAAAWSALYLAAKAARAALDKKEP